LSTNCGLAPPPAIGLPKRGYRVLGDNLETMPAKSDGECSGTVALLPQLTLGGVWT
jgi:hypothetical protein